MGLLTDCSTHRSRGIAYVFALLLVLLLIPACGGGGGGGDDGDDDDDGGQQTASYGDRTASALGNATLTTQDGTLVVSNFGTSGEDGVSIPSHETGTDALHFNQIDLSAQGNTVSFAITENTGAPGEGEAIAELELENTGNSIDYSITQWDGSDWSTSVLSGDEVAGDSSGSGSDPPSGSLAGGAQVTGVAARQLNGGGAFTLELDSDVEITLPDGSSAEGDTLNITPQESGNQTSQVDPAPWDWEIIGGGPGGGGGGGPGPIIIDLPPIPIPLGSCDLEINKSATGSFALGNTATITISITNNGFWDCWEAVQVTDVLPPGLHFVSGSASSGWSCTSDGGDPETVTCEGSGPRSSGASEGFSFDVQVGDLASCTLGNTATVEQFDLPSDMSNIPAPLIDNDDSNNTDHTLIDTGVGECVEPPAGLVGWWTGNRTTDDISGNGNHGTLMSNAGYNSGYVEHSFRFGNLATADDPNRDDFVEVDHDDVLNFGTSNFTVDAWVRLLEHGTEPKPIVYKRGEVQLDSGNIVPVGYSMYLEDAAASEGETELFFELNDQNGNAEIVSSVSVPRAEWAHVAGVADRNNGELRLYIDGDQVATEPIPDDFGSIDNQAPLTIGRTGFFPDDPTRYFRGQIDEVELFRGALSEADIQSVVQARTCGKCPPEGDGRVDLATEKFHEDEFVSGQQNEYKIEVANLGNAPASSPIVVEDNLPSGFSVANVSAPSPWTCNWDSSNQEITCNDTQLAAGDAFFITLTVDVPQDAGEEVENCAIVQHPDDVNPDNDESCDPTTVMTRDRPDAALTKSSEGDNFQFGVNEWNITVENPGNTTLTDPIRIADTVPSGVNVLSVSPAACSWDGTNSEIVCNTTLTPNDTLDITLTVEVTQDAGDLVENCAEVLLEEDTDPDNNSDCDEVPVVPGEDCEGECTQPPEGLVSWWPLEQAGPSGVPMADDIVDGNPGDPAGGVTLISGGKVGNALFFDGNDDVVEVPDSASIDSAQATNFTVDAWIRPTPAAVNSTSPILNKLDTSGSSPVGFALRLESGGDLVAELGDGSSTSTVNAGSGSIPANQWSHVAMAFDQASGTTLYINGTQAASGSSPNSSVTNSVPLLFGQNQGRDQLFAGVIDEIELFDGLLSQNQIAAIHSAGPCGKCKGFTCRDKADAIEPPSGMVAWWTLDESSGPTAFDGVGGNNGTWIDDPTPTTASAAKVDTALSFDASDDDSAFPNESDHVEVPDDASLDFGTGSFTIDAWVNPLQQQNELYPVVHKSTAEPFQGYEFSLILTGDQLAVDLTVADGNQNTASASTSGAVPFDQWTHVAGVLDRPANEADELRVYVNGTLEATQSLPNAFGGLSNDRNLFIGRDHAGFGYFSGQIDEVELFDRALDQSEIQAIFDADASGKCKDNLNQG